MQVSDLPDKSLGQHWLFDDNILGTIAGYTEINPGEKVIEIGPGLGTLTKKLLECGANVTALEFDEKLANELPNKVKSSNLTVLCQDVLKYNFENFEDKYKICANIPYYLTSNLIRILTSLNNSPERIVLLIQKEVAERICSNPGNMSLLSVYSQMKYRCRLGLIVKSELFTPPPKVDSQVIIMDKLVSPYLPSNPKTFNRILKLGFSSKRKKLINNLCNSLHISKEQISGILLYANLKPGCRAQELTVEDWMNLSREVDKYLTR